MWPGMFGRDYGRTGLTGVFSRWENVMSTQLGTAAPARPALSVRNKTGLVLAILLGLFDLASPLALRQTDGSTAAGPPTAVLIADAVLGLVTVVAAIYMWMSRNRVGGRIVAGARILSVISALPSFFVSGEPSPVIVLVAAIVVVTVVTVVLVLARPKPVA
jgi:hypothetical protein